MEWEDHNAQIVYKTETIQRLADAIKENNEELETLKEVKEDQKSELEEKFKRIQDGSTQETKVMCV